MMKNQTTGSIRKEKKSLKTLSRRNHVKKTDDDDKEIDTNTEE